jgi:hypothetical protein
MGRSILPLLSRIFQVHISAEYCSSVKYICKYVNRSIDQALFGLEKDGRTMDEVGRYQLDRYICRIDAV